jgi:glycosyltransferase involved in cell wall biosynthesis
VKRVLIVTYYFPPSGGPGVQRVLKFVKYLPQFGWQPAVLTVLDGDYPARDPSLLKEIPADVPVHRTPILEPYTVYRKLTGRKKGEAVDVNTNYRPGTKVSWREKLAQGVRGALFVPDARVGWLLHGIPTGVNVVRNWGADLIFSSSPPYTCALLGRAVGRRTGRPWVFELRDPWTGFLSAPVRHGVSRRLDRHLEKSCVLEAARVVMAWRGIGRDLTGKYPDLDPSRFRLVENGFDPDDLNVEPKRFDRFTVVYTGSMYGVRNPDTLLRAVAGLLETGRIRSDEVRFVFVGRFGDDVRAMFRRPELQGVVEEIGHLPHEESVRYTLGADVLLLVVDDVKGSEGIVPGKVFEYLGSRRPVLAVAPEGDVADLIRRTRAGVVVDRNDLAGMGAALESWITERRTTGRVPFQGDEREIEKLSRRNRTGLLAGIFDEVMSERAEKERRVASGEKR